MALVLRNAALQKHVSLLKCMKTRTVVTTTNKNNNQAPLSAVMKRRTLRQIFKATFRLPSLKFNPLSTLKRDAHTAAIPLYKSVSCPELGLRFQLDDRTQFIDDNWLKARSATNFAKPFVVKTARENVLSIPKGLDDIIVPKVFENIAQAVCPCPCPCPCPPSSCGPCCGGPCFGNMADCNCARLLPPPCNTPPRCIQYMTGYYYYPYGTWFCGPYHVCTGGVPVCGPVCPGTTCGIAPPNPNLLCKCGPCGPCCCGLLSCSICNPQVSSSGAPPSGGLNWGPNTNPNVQSCFGAPGMPAPQGSTMSSSQSFGPLPMAQSAQGFGPLPTSQSAQGFGPLPTSQSAQGFGPIPTSQSAQGFGPIPTSQSAQGFGPLPMQQGMPGFGPLSLPQSSQGFGPLPMQQGMPGFGPLSLPQGSQGFGPLPLPQGSQGNGSLPMSQDSWGQIQGSLGIPVPFGVPGSTIQTPLPGGAGINVSFPPVAMGPLPQNMNSSPPSTPQWATSYAPCECPGCVTQRQTSPIEIKSAPEPDTPKVMQSIIEPFTKMFPAPKLPKNLTQQCKETSKCNKIMEDPKVKASFPLSIF